MRLMSTVAAELELDFAGCGKRECTSVEDVLAGWEVGYLIEKWSIKGRRVYQGRGKIRLKIRLKIQERQRLSRSGEIFG
jgi:hypothetical protein